MVLTETEMDVTDDTMDKSNLNIFLILGMISDGWDQIWYVHSVGAVQLHLHTVVKSWSLLT